MIEYVRFIKEEKQGHEIIHCKLIDKAQSRRLDSSGRSAGDTPAEGLKGA